MFHWIEQLEPGGRVLDVASGPGSFPAALFPCMLVSLDEDPDAFRTAAPLPPGPCYRVFGRAGRLPFAPAAFDLVICHHALEHVADLAAALTEVARVLKPDGRFFVSVPAGYGLCDGIYRYLFEGGGHVQRFRRQELAAEVERLTGLRLVRWRTLYSSFVYIRRLREMLDDPPTELAPRLARVARLPRPLLPAAQRFLCRATRAIDRRFGSRLSVYGWALYFERTGAPREPVEEPGYLNVCAGCGAGHPSASLSLSGRTHYVCPACSARNRYAPPFGNTV